MADALHIAVFGMVPLALILFGGPWRFSADSVTQKYKQAYGWLPVYRMREGGFHDIKAVEVESFPSRNFVRIHFRDGSISPRYGDWSDEYRAVSEAKEASRVMSAPILPVRRKTDTGWLYVDSPSDQPIQTASVRRSESGIRNMMAGRRKMTLRELVIALVAACVLVSLSVAFVIWQRVEVLHKLLDRQFWLGLALMAGAAVIGLPLSIIWQKHRVRAGSVDGGSVEGMEPRDDASKE